MSHNDPLPSAADRRQAIAQALQTLATQPLAQGATALLATLGYRSDKTADLGHDAEALLSSIEQFRPESGAINRAKVQASRWKSCAFLFQLSNDEIPSLAMGQAPLDADGALEQGQMESLVFLAIELQGEPWTRTELATITRELNKRFPMPAILLFRHGALFSLAVIDRRANLRDASRDVIDSRITVIKDVRLAGPHRAHIDILASLALANLGDRRRPGNFRELYRDWITTLSTEKLNQRFYQQLAWWYLWASKEVDFPQGGGAKRNEIGVIRLLTRLIFVWFIKERGLVPQALFERDSLKSLLKQAPDATPDDSTYYHAILQNLFFATLNQEMGGERRWAKSGGGMKDDYLIPHVYRFEKAFRQPATVLQDEHSFGTVPFLNGGLFECLDRELTDQNLVRHPELKKLAVKEGNGWVLRVDGFSRRADAQAQVPNKLFFGGTDDARLNTDFQTRGKRYPVQGLIDLLDSYKFTVDENTPLDEEVALDPELLGKVFENLLASYNEDTKITARKQSGSFYTPRVVVDYMVDEALIAYLARQLDAAPTDAAPEGADQARLHQRLRRLLSHADTGHDFSAAQADALVAAIEHLKAFDPACGSGAFPMGILAKLVVALKKLDPDNHLWRAQNLAPLQARLDLAKKTPDPVQRDQEIAEAEAALDKHNKDFADPAYADYTRKLYLIEKCIFGSDIQPVAVQIAKLRFFIALIVSQPIDKAKPNWGIIPLPNLETKIVAANTLFGVPRQGAQASLLNDPAIAEKEGELRDANAAYFTARNRASKKRRKLKVQQLHEELVALLQRDGFVTPQDAERMARWNPFDQNRFADFFDVEWMYGLPRATDGTEAVFDIVIANPPYVRQEEIKDLKPLLKDVYQYDCYTGTADLFVYFYERSVKLLKPHGALSFITSNKWYRAKYGEPLRQFMATHTRLHSIIDFGDEAVFTAIAYPTIVVATRRPKPLHPPPADDAVRVLNWQQTQTVEDFPAVFEAEAFEVPQAELKKQGWQLEPPAKRLLLARIRKAGQPLGEYVNGRFYYGIKTGFNDAFVIDGATRARLIAEDPKSEDVIKPFLRGRDVKKWKITFEDKWLILVPNAVNIDEYNAVKKHLKIWERELISRSGSQNWYALQAEPAELSRYLTGKIIYPDIADKSQFAWDGNNYFSADTTFFIPTEDKSLLSILNSSICFWYFSQLSPRIQNGYYRFKSQYCSQIPIPFANLSQKQILITLVELLLLEINHLIEQLINGLVFELFFPDDLHRANIRLFDACEQAGVGQLASLEGQTLASAAKHLAERIFANDHPIYAQLFDLQALPVVRIIEGKE